METHDKAVFLLRIEIVIMLISIYLYISGLINAAMFIFIIVCLFIGVVWLREYEKFC
jgi:hypothetical protein